MNRQEEDGPLSFFISGEKIWSKIGVGKLVSIPHRTFVRCRRCLSGEVVKSEFPINDDVRVTLAASVIRFQSAFFARSLARASSSDLVTVFAQFHDDDEKHMVVAIVGCF